MDRCSKIGEPEEFIQEVAKRIVDDAPNGFSYKGHYDDIVDVVENGKWGIAEWGIDLYLEERNKTWK